MTTQKSKKNLSLAGCGFMGIYHVGVIKAFKERRPEYLEKIAGTSCGALVGAAAICDSPIDEIANMFCQLGNEGRSYLFGPFSPSFNLPRLLRNLLEKTLPEDAHIRCNNRLSVSITRSIDTQSVIVNKYESREDLIQVLICSTFVPVYSGIHFPTYKDTAYYDGCWSDNNPQIDEHSLTVSPFNGESDICPKNESAGYHCSDFQNTSVLWCFENVNRVLKVFFPPDPQLNSAIYYKGYKDAIFYIKSEEMET